LRRYIEGFAHDCGAMLHEPETTNLGLLDCAVHAVAAAAAGVAEDGAVDVSLRRERVMPFRSSGSVVSYTLHVQPPAPHGKTAVTGTATAAVARVRAALAVLASDPKALRRTAEAGGCDAQRTAWLSMLPVVAVDARAGCAPGLHGPGCTYACMGRWERNDVGTPAPHDYYAEFAPNPDDPVSLHDLPTSPSGFAGEAAHGHRGLVSAASLGRGGGTGAHELRRHVVQYWEGEEEEKHHRSVSLQQCSISCRGNANRAMVTCHDWIDDRTSAAKRRECAAHLKDMGKFCQVMLKGPASQCTSYTKAKHQADDHECQVCGIQRYFEQHGVYGGGQSHYTTHDVSVYSNGETAINAVHLNDAKRKAKAVEAEEAAKAAALGLNPEVPADPSPAEMAARSEDYMRARLGGVLPRRAISHAVNDGSSNANDVHNGDDASHLADLHEQVFKGMTVRSVMDAQFPTCRGDERCAETCVLSARSATDTCMAWLHAPPPASGGGGGGGNHSDTAALGTAACADALDAARASCGAEESARCVEPLAAGFHSLGIPGGVTADPDPDPVGRRRFTVSKPVLKVPVVQGLETRIS
jgi:hypothetical protein